MFGRFAIIPVVLCLSLAIAAAATNEAISLDTLKNSYKLAKAKIESERAGHEQEALKKCMMDLDRLEAKMRNAGDLDGLMAVRKQKDLMLKQEASTPAETSTNVIPAVEAIITQYHTALAEDADRKDRKTVDLMKRYVESLKTLETDLVKRGNMTDAVDVKTESEAVSSELQELSAKLPPPPPPSAPPAEVAKQPKPKSHLTGPISKKKATIYISCDNHYVIWLRGKEIGRGEDWQQMGKYQVEIGEGDNLSIEGTDDENGEHSAGVYCCIVFDGENKSWGTDKTWHCTVKKQPANWQKGKIAGELQPVSTINVASEHSNALEIYRGEYDRNLQGGFVWSKESSKVIYVSEEISFNNFTTPAKR